MSIFFRAQPLYNFKPRQAGEHNVEYDDVVQAAARVFKPVGARMHRVHQVFFLFHDMGQRLGQTDFVLYDQYLHMDSPFFHYNTIYLFIQPNHIQLLLKIV